MILPSFAALLVLQYLTFIRLDISYRVQQVCLRMHDPRELHLLVVKRILRAQLIMACFFIVGRPWSLLSTRMLIRKVVQTHASPHQSMLYFSVTTWCPDRPKHNIQSPVLVIKQNIGLSPMEVPKLAGCVSYFRSSIVLSPRAHSFTIIMSTVYLSTNPNKYSLPLHQPSLASTHEACLD